AGRQVAGTPAGRQVAGTRAARQRVGASGSRLALEAAGVLAGLRLRRRLLWPAGVGAREGGADELAEQRRRAVRAGLELGVVLRRHEERVLRDLDDLDQPLVRRRARDGQPGGLQAAAQEVVDLVA